MTDPEKRVWIAQCLCPERHCIAALATEAVDQAAAEPVRAQLRELVAGMLGARAIDPWCGLCNAPADRWQYELGRTRFRTMREAEPALKQNAAEQAAARAMFGDLHLNGKPN